MLSLERLKYRLDTLNTFLIQNYMGLFLFEEVTSFISGVLNRFVFVFTS